MNINGADVSIDNQFYPYKAHILNLFCQSKEEKLCSLESEMYYHEHTGLEDSFPPKKSGVSGDDDTSKKGILNTGFGSWMRQQRFKFGNYLDDPPAELEKLFGNTCEMYGRLQTDFNTIDEPLPPSSYVRLNFSRSKEAFYMLVKETNDMGTFCCIIEKFELIVPFAILEDKEFLEIERRIKKRPAEYYYSKLFLTRHSILQGNSRFEFNNPFTQEKTPGKILF